MALSSLIPLLGRLVFGTIAAFFAIIVWTQMRDTAWVLILCAVLLLYVDVVISLLGVFGMLPQFTILDIPIFSTILASIPFILCIFAFIILIRRQ